MTLTDYLHEQCRLVDRALDKWVPSESEPPQNLHKAMRYSLFAGGKRIRPVLCLAAADSVANHPAEWVVDAACTLELIHTYSLIHDDLPAMDNDDLRRGRPTCHKVFGDAMAILAGDALLTLAFEVMPRSGMPAERCVALTRELAASSGSLRGMIAGQVHDMEGEGQPPTPELLESIHRAKTGALLRASVRMGAVCAGATESQYESLSRYGEHVGLAFQIIDDVLDVEQPSEALGKTAGKDAAQGKITFPAVYGIERSKHMADAELQQAHDCLSSFGDRAHWLHELADLIVHRTA